MRQYLNLWYWLSWNIISYGKIVQILISLVANFDWLLSMSRMNFTMVTYLRKYLWSSHLSLILRGSIGTMFASWRKHYNILSSQQDHGKFYIRFSRILVSTIVKWIIKFSTCRLMLDIYLFVDDIVITGMILMALPDWNNPYKNTFTSKILANFGSSWELKLQDLSKASSYLKGSTYLI